VPTTPAFELASGALERETYFDRLAARGTIRLALRQAGLDAHSVTSHEMAGVVENLLPAELECRGIEEAADICARLKARLAQLETSPQGNANKSLFSSENLGKPRSPGDGEELA
jgi:hypothetical protein